MVVLIASTTACGSGGGFGTDEFAPRQADVLTVATELPGPPYWVGKRPERVDGGFEYGIARAIASHLGLRLRVVDVSFDDVVAGRLHGADFALDQVTITPSRRSEVSFSLPYYRSDFGIVARQGVDIPDLKSAREQRWAVKRETTQLAFLREVVQPDEDLVLVDSIDDVVDAVRSGRVDAGLLDTTTALALTNGERSLHVPAQFAVNEQWGAVLPKGSSNRIALDRELRRLISNGTIDDLERKWIFPVTGQRPGSVRVIVTKEAAR